MKTPDQRNYSWRIFGLIFFFIRIRARLVWSYLYLWNLIWQYSSYASYFETCFRLTESHRSLFDRRQGVRCIPIVLSPWIRTILFIIFNHFQTHVDLQIVLSSLFRQNFNSTPASFLWNRYRGTATEPANIVSFGAFLAVYGHFHLI